MDLFYFRQEPFHLDKLLDNSLLLQNPQTKRADFFHTVPVPTSKSVAYKSEPDVDQHPANIYDISQLINFDFNLNLFRAYLSQEIPVSVKTLAVTVAFAMKLLMVQYHAPNGQFLEINLY